MDDLDVRAVSDDVWNVLAWLWQCFRHDLAMIVTGLPYADGPPVVRREGIGRRLALDVIGRHPAPWSVAFQHDNVHAAAFWRRVADDAFGPGRWREEERPVPGLPGVPPDHWIETSEASRGPAVT
jgi:hypothetical protein